MFDSAQRNIHYLRLSVTDLCNLRCRYCMPDGVEKLEREAVLTYEEFLRLAALFARCGVDTVQVLFSQRQKVVLTLAIRYVTYFVQLRIAKVNVN